MTRNAPDDTKLPHLLLEALNCRDDAEFQSIASRWDDISEATHQLVGLTSKQLRGVFPDDYRKMSREFFHQYFQVVVRVVDDHGSRVDDYYIEFFNADQRGRQPAVVFHREVLEDVHPAAPRATRCFYIDRTDLMEVFYKRALGRRPKDQKTLNATISAVRPGQHVHYMAKGVTERRILAHSEHKSGESRFLRRNCSHFLEIVIPRNPEEDVFKLAQR